MSNINIDNQNINLEISLLLEAIFNKYGYDFRNYSKAHIKRRILHRLSLSGLDNISAMTHKAIYDKNFASQILLDFSINVTEMFRDPDFYFFIRKEVIPILKTYPFVKIWHAGCATGEEVYSMAILLKEENLYDRTQIYATDFNAKVIKSAKDGIYSIKNIKDFTRNYQKAGGKESFSDYYTANYNSVIIDNSLKKNIVFSEHNLVTDSVFAEVNMIICRNVLIYFNRDLQNKVMNLFNDSLVPGGILGLGTKESLQFLEKGKNYNCIDLKNKIYRKKYNV
ncbi:MAG: protein-glutamate O-methyltransferase CheR [Bacteroidales bacterium]|nr:protein-glutamate O-methyltransferase CheR [Bacteroidales bacterium]